MRERADATTSMRALMLARGGLVVALGDGLGEIRQLLGHPASARDQQLAAVGDVGDAVARALPAGAHAA